MNIDEVNKISEGIAILFLSIISFSLGKLFLFEDWLSAIPAKGTRAILVYVAGLALCEKKATSNKIANKIGFVSHDKLTRTLIDGKRIIDKLSVVLINFCLAQTSGWLIIDDVLLPKPFASQITGTYRDFDHVTKEHTKGMRIVMIVWSNGKVRIPVAWAIWHKEEKHFIGFTPKGFAKYEHTGQSLLKINGEALPYKTKNQIALELLEEVASRGLKAEYITFDIWYAGKKNLTMITHLPFASLLQCYARLKPNRKVVYQEQEMSLTTLSRRFPTATFNHKHGAYIRAINVHLPGFGDINLLIVRDDHHQEEGKSKYLFTTDLTASAPQILLRYRSRWIIETAFRDMKQNLSLESCQARSLDAQESHISLSIFSFVLLELLPDLHFEGKTAHTIGEKKSLFGSLALFTNKYKTHHWVINSDKANSRYVPASSVFLGKVKLCFAFAYKMLVNSDCQRTA